MRCIKYLGSKSRIAKDIVPIIQQCIDDVQPVAYLEPFVGGANIFDKIHCSSKIGSDSNDYLIALLDYVAHGGKLLDEVPRVLYNRIRDLYNSGVTSGCDKWYLGNVGFLASYNGRFFDGGYAQPGFEKTSKGLRYRDYYQEAKRNLEKQAPDLAGAKFICRSYREFVPHNMVVYCDPPYANTKQYANSNNFNHDLFWQTIREWSVDNFVLISELSAPDDFECLWEKSVSRSIKATDKSRATEKLFTYNKGKYADKYRR